MLIPPPGGLIPSTPDRGLIPRYPDGGLIPRYPPAGLITSDPPAGLRSGDPRGEPRKGSPAGRPPAEGRPASLVPDGLSGSPAAARPAPMGLPPAMLAALTAQCPGLRVDRVLPYGGKSVLAVGYVGEQPVMIKTSAGADELWRLRQQHEIAVYLIFAKHPPPVRVPRMFWTDGESVVVMERLEGTSLDVGRYPRRLLTEQEIHATTGLVRRLHDWRPLPGGFLPVFGYPTRIARYHAAGYFGDADRRALDGLLARCGEPSQLNHGDPLPGNILRTPGGEWALLDWEFTGLFLPGFDLAMLRILLAQSPTAPGHIEDIVAETGQRDAYLVNLAVVLSRERRIHSELPESHPLRVARLPALEETWLRARDRIHAAAAQPGG
jgi:hypothetical protein